MKDAAPSVVPTAAQPSESPKPASPTSEVYQPVPQQTSVNTDPVVLPSGEGSSIVVSPKTGNPQFGPYVPFDIKPVAPQSSSVQVDTEKVKLTAEMLPGLWSKLFESEQWMKGLLEEEREELKHLIHGKEVEFEDESTFSIIADSSYYQTRIRPYVVHMLDELRKVSGIESLNCFCKVHYKLTDAVPYSAKEKYEAMLLINNTLLNFRQMFDEIDL